MKTNELKPAVMAYASIFTPAISVGRSGATILDGKIIKDHEGLYVPRNVINLKNCKIGDT